MTWLQLRVHTAKPEFAEELLLAHGANAVSLVDAGDDPVLEPAPGATPLWPRTVTVGMFADQHPLDPVIASLQELLPEGLALKTETELLEDQEWIRVWLKDCPPLKFGERLWVVPHERASEVTDPQAVVVKLDPGLAFGTGTHPSTALCLEWLAAQQLGGSRILDYGCGSGILAIAALKLGADRAVATDIDPQALKAAKDNAERNGVGERLTTIAVDDDEFVPFPADAVLANILANPLIRLAPLLASSVRPGGHVVLAGLLDSQAAEVQQAYEPWCDFEPARRKDGWSLLVGRCRRPALINDFSITPRLRTAGQPYPEHFGWLAQEGIESVINLAVPASPNFLADEERRWLAHDVTYRHIPVKWSEPTADDLQEFFDRMEELGERRVLVHCAMNKRVSVFVFLYRVLRQKIPPALAARDLHRIWRPNDVWRDFIERTLQQHQVKFPLEKN
jgi:ribosomal protein L11 methyltransferase